MMAEQSKNAASKPPNTAFGTVENTDFLLSFFNQAHSTKTRAVAQVYSQTRSLS
jgi:hypothetical protein